jgi:hypothetical protein
MISGKSRRSTNPAIPVHYDGYTAFRSGLQDFVDAARQEAPAVGLRIARRGETVPLGSSPPPNPGIVPRKETQPWMKTQ